VGAREVFDSMCRAWIGDPADLDDLWAQDVVVEAPFAGPGRPRRFDGREAFVAFARAGREAMRVRIEECRDVIVHQTTDPDVIVAEYVLVGRSEVTGQRGSLAFIGVLRARDGKVAHWREYQNTAGMAAALAG
jgi:ketosteroid isomerase-like protein